jgi:hypothetical protein
MKPILIGSAALAVVVVLSGCTAGAASLPSSDSAAPMVQEPATGVAGPNDASSGSGAVDGGITRVEGGAAVDEAVDRQVVTTGSMTVTADDPVEAAGAATSIVERVGGRVDARRETAPTDDGRGSATLTVRVPSETLTATIDELGALGTAQDVALDTVDVTTRTQDLAARINASRASVDRLTALLATATDVEVLIKLETAISERQGALESMEAEQRSLADQVSLSTIDLYLVSPEDSPAETPDTFWSGLVTGWTSFTGFIGFVLVAAGVLIPWLAVTAVAGLVVVVAMKRMRRRTTAGTPRDSSAPA